jgi:thiosulfate/3-mercaptopyruvate sulfurtransferase
MSFAWRAFSRTFAAALLVAVVTVSASAAEPLVDVSWLKANLGKPGVVILDLRSGGGATKQTYLAGHIPGAVFTDYAKDGWREKNKAGVAGMLPAPDKLEALIGRLGIDNQSHVVLVANGKTAADMGAATRVYWTLKVLGHDTVSILDGGHLAWIAPVGPDKKPVNPLETADVKPAAKTFTARLRNEMLVSRADVAAALANKTPLIDNRPYDFHVGLTKSPAAKRAGTLPGASHMPEGWVTENGGGHFRSKAQIGKLYAVQSIPTQGDQITFCNTGHWASLGWFVSSEILGNKTARMYDGSMAEWTQDPAAPVEQKVKAE